MNILIWHVHGAWTTAFVQGKHRYLVPATPDRGPYGLGRARTYPWPDSAVEVNPTQLAGADVDLVVLQRPEEHALASRWLGRQVGRDVPAVYVEHNTPRADVPATRHPMADRDDLLLVHVTHFNELFWDAGGTRTTVIEHGVLEPAVRYSGELARLAIATNEPVRRWRVTGTDLMPRFAAVAPLDVFGMGVAGLPRRLRLPGPGCAPPASPGRAQPEPQFGGGEHAPNSSGRAQPEPQFGGGEHAQILAGDTDRLRVYDDPPQARLHAELAHRRAYLHLTRWTSLGLSLLEAMAIGMPVLALATTEAVVAIPTGAGVLDTRVQTLVEAAEWLIGDAGAARQMGERARQAVLARYGVDRFLADWDQLLEEETCASR